MTTEAIRERGLLEALSNALQTGQHIEHHRAALISFYRRLGLYG